MTGQLAAMRDVVGTRVALIGGVSVNGGSGACGSVRGLWRGRGAHPLKVPTEGQALATAAAWTGAVPLATLPTAFPHLGPIQVPAGEVVT
ncbi:hypothetical protein NKH18_48890 [Streptomyces sp. M10(2022)]